MKAAPPIDSSLTRRLLAGDESAFSEFVAAEHAGLVRFVRGFCSADSADEVAQDAWLAFIENLSRFEGRSSLRTFLFAIAANKARTRAARDGRQVSFDEPNPSEPAVPLGKFRPDGHWRQLPESWAVSPERDFMRSEARAVLQVAIDSLPANQRTVLVLRDVQGFDSDEVCNVLGITETNQRVLLHRARTRVREALDGYMKGEE